MKTITKLLALTFIFILGACSSSDDSAVDTTPDPVTPTPTPKTVFEKLQGNTFQQVEKTSDCNSCEDEINYYIFSPDAIQITGTTYEEVCEQNDVQPIGNCADCLTVEEDTTERLTLCLGSICQTITFLSDDEIKFDFPAAGETWTAQRYTEAPPCTDWDPVGDGEDTVLERLKGNTYQQIETVDTCGTCDDEKNYYMFLEDGIRITGTTLDDVCEQNDYTAFGDDIDIELNTTEELRICIGTFPFRFCQTITFLSDTEIHFDFPAFSQTWTAQLYTDDVPCTDWTEGPTTTNPIYSGTFGGAVYDNGTFLFPSGSQTWAGFANEDTGLYPLSFPNGGKVTFNAATEGATDIVVKFVFERLPFDAEGNGAADTQPSFETATVTVSGTDTKEYSVDFGSQGDNTFRSALLYLITQDQTLTASGFDITTN